MHVDPPAACGPGSCMPCEGILVRSRREWILQVVPPAWLRLFSTQEVAQLLSGGEAGAVSVQDLRQHAAYSGGFTARSSTVVAFWKVCWLSVLL